MLFDGCFDFTLFDANVPLCDGCATMLEQVLYQGDIVPVVPVDFCGIVFPETVGADSGNVQIVANDPQLLLHGPFCDGEYDVRGGDAVIQTITSDKLIQGERNCKHTGFPGFLLDDG